ncbi:MAG: capsular polysaccharide biosynthesis protein [Desulfovibrio sp.]|nr:capsular polysaccharide biosynthesis protein [Desulfovibrio sp.]
MRILWHLGRQALAGLRALRPQAPGWVKQYFRPQAPGWYAFFSPGLARIPHLSAFVGAPVLRLPCFRGADALWPRLLRGCCGVLTWGVKERLRPTACAALTCAQRFQLPLLRLEDGFLRSLDLGVNGAAPLSLVVDATGIYYDATRPSDLENLLNATGWESPELLSRARLAIQDILDKNLSKYNHAPDPGQDCLPSTGRRLVLILDQTFGDLSVELGMAEASTFAAMLQTARDENPEADIVIKTHPDTLSGKKRGYFMADSLPAGVRLLARDVAPLPLLRHADRIYTVSSQMGFEALLLGKTVHCFGMPFYAGWGLTVDHQHCARRTRRRSLEEVFAAAYLSYARYVQPVSGTPCDIGDTIRLLSEQRRVNERNRGFHACVGFRWWKKPHARAFLASTGGQTRFYRHEETAVSEAVRCAGEVVVWGSRETAGLAKRCATAGVRLTRMEDGFVRSVGLGSDFLRPGSLVLDDAGIYYDPGRPSRLEILLNGSFTEQELADARRVREELVARNLSKYNLSGRADLPQIPVGKKVVLVPGQVEDDASVRLGGCGIEDNLALLKAVRAQRPDAFIIYKEHPDVVRGNRAGALDWSRLQHVADALVRTAPIGAVFPLCHEVHTLTSLTGFEALLRGIPVFTYGGPFYAGWGLTTDRLAFARRHRLPSLDYLVAVAILRYPYYYDWYSRMAVDCLSCIRSLDAVRSRCT